MIEDRSARSPIALSTREMLIGCAAVLLVFSIGVGFRAAGSRWPGGESWSAGGDFVAFYVAGRMLNEHDGARLYDAELQETVYRTIVPGGTWRHRTFYPPFIAALFQPLALLAFSTALLVFMILTPVVMLAGLLLLRSRFGAAPAEEGALMLLAGLSFFPFLGYTWLGAQISTLGFFAVSCAIVADDRDRPFASGAALSLCLYKPTLLLLLLPMLLVTGRLRQVAGVVAGAGLLGLVWLAAGGIASVPAFFHQVGWTIDRSLSAGQTFNPYRYVDVNAFVRLLPYGRSWGALILVAAFVAIVAVALVATWLRSRTADRPERLLVWAATLTWTLVLNLYVPFYDTVLVVAAAMVAVAAVRARGWRGWNRLGPALLCVYLSPWIAETCARTFRLQIYTLVLAAFGSVLLVEANRRP